MYPDNEAVACVATTEKNVSISIEHHLSPQIRCFLSCWRIVSSCIEIWQVASASCRRGGTIRSVRITHLSFVLRSCRFCGASGALQIRRLSHVWLQRKSVSIWIDHHLPSQIRYFLSSSRSVSNCIEIWQVVSETVAVPHSLYCEVVACEAPTEPVKLQIVASAATLEKLLSWKWTCLFDQHLSFFQVASICMSYGGFDGGHLWQIK